MYERAWPRWLWSYVVGPQTYIFTTPGVRDENGSFLLERVLYNRRTMVAANASTGTALLSPWPAPAGMRAIPLRRAASGDESYMSRADVHDRRGPIDQRKIAAFARR